jgi:hypothetical protein
MCSEDYVARTGSSSSTMTRDRDRNFSKRFRIPVGEEVGEEVFVY